MPVLGLTGRWRFYEKGVGSACRDVRFLLFRTVTFDTNQTVETTRNGRSKPLAGTVYREQVKCSKYIGRLAYINIYLCSLVSQR